MMRAAPANMQTSRNLMPQLRTHLTPARRTSRLNWPSVPGMARYRVFLRPHTDRHPHSQKCHQAPAPAKSQQILNYICPLHS